jgi:hypothetical protein
VEGVVLHADGIAEAGICERVRVLGICEPLLGPRDSNDILLAPNNTINETDDRLPLQHEQHEEQHGEQEEQEGQEEQAEEKEIDGRRDGLGECVFTEVRVEKELSEIVGASPAGLQHPRNFRSLDHELDEQGGGALQLEQEEERDQQQEEREDLETPPPLSDAEGDDGQSADENDNQDNGEEGTENVRPERLGTLRKMGVVCFLACSSLY